MSVNCDREPSVPTKCGDNCSYSPSLRSKRFHRVRANVFSAFWLRKGWGKQKNGKEGGGEGRRRKRLQANPTILKNLLVHERASQGI